MAESLAGMGKQGLRVAGSLWRGLKNRVLYWLMDSFPGGYLGVRRQVAQDYLKGEGIEVGALHNPLPLPRKARVTYVDRMTVPELRKHYAEFRKLDLTPVSIVSNGETLEAVADQSQDFVIGNHLIEHAEDPIRMLENWLRVLRPGGVIYLTVPDKRFTFDKPREVTSIEHLVRDHREGPAASRRTHYREWVEKVARTPPAKVEAEIERLDAEDYSIHFHVWESQGFIEFLSYCRSMLGLPFELSLVRRNEGETIFILSKC